MRSTRRSWSGALRSAALLALAAWLVTGCNAIRYYGQAGHGQLQILHRQKSIPRLIADSNTAPSLRTNLQRVVDLRSFAERELHLPADGHYLAFADLGRPFAVWNVYAAPEFSLDAKSWWYPIVGRLKYRGYFSELAARRLAADLALRGYDVYVGGVQAYSTLGWFRDPVLNTFVFEEERDLAELLFHELAHQRVFVAGDTDFNEAFATAVAEEGVRRWLRRRSGPEALAEYEAGLQRKEQFLELCARARTELAALYLAHASDPGAPDNYQARLKRDLAAIQLRETKQTVFANLRRDHARLKELWGGRSDFDPWFRHPLNNARLNTLETYYQFVPAFRNLLRQSDGHLDTFFKEVDRLAKMNAHQRRHHLDALAQPRK